MILKKKKKKCRDIHPRFSSISQDDGDVLAPKDKLASLLGTTPRHLNRVLKELIETNVIRVEYPTIHILNRQALCAINS